MIYHISKGAPKSTNPKIKEILRFYKPFRADVRGTRRQLPEGGGEGGGEAGGVLGLRFPVFRGRLLL